METLADQWRTGHAAHSADSQNRIENAYKCLQLVKELFAFNSVVDFGCGIGAWLYAAKMHGATHIQGLEGPWITNATVVIPRENIRTVDFSVESVTFDKRFDLAISIEVIEHLPEVVADMFCKGLTSASERILFSAAIPGQGGIGHINEQPLSYWCDKFWALGYVPLEPIRPYIQEDRKIYPWLRQNLIMFVSYKLLRNEGLLRHARPLNDFTLRYYPQ